MEISATELGKHPGKFIEQAVRGVELYVTVREKRKVRLVPVEEDTSESEAAGDDYEDELFGLWRDRKDLPEVADYVRELRKGRSL